MTTGMTWKGWSLALALLLGGCAGTPAAGVPAVSSGPASSKSPSASTARSSASAASASSAPAEVTGTHRSAGTSASPAAAGTGSSAGAAASQKPLSQSKLNFAIPVSSGLQVLPQLAQDAGYFKEEGLDVTITQIPGSQEVIAALNKGDLDMANSDSPSVIRAHMSGILNEIVAVPVSKPIFDFMVPASITKPEELKGKTIGVTKICDSTCFQITHALQSWGLKPQQDVKLIALKDYPGMFAGLKSNQLAGAPLAPPFNFEAKKLGFHSLADLSQLPIDYPTAVVQTTRKFAEAHPDTVKAFLRAYVKAIHRYKTDETFTVEVYRKFLKSNDTAVIQDTWGYYQKLMHEDPTPTVEGVKFVLGALAEAGDQKAKTANPSDFIAPTFMEQVKASGLTTPTGKS